MLLASAVFAASEGAALSAALGTFGAHVALPAVIRGAPRALAVAGPTLASGANRWRAAAAVALAAVAEPVALVLFAAGASATGEGEGGGGGGGGVGGGGLLNSASSVGSESCAAVLLAGVSLRMLLPSARSVDAGRASAGFAVGVGVAAVALATLGALCWQTPYCDRRW